MVTSLRHVDQRQTFGFGSVPKRRYHEDKTPILLTVHLFGTPNAVSVRGLGSAVANSVSTQMKQVEAGGDVPDVIQYNLEIGSAQGFITPADEAILREQLSQVNIDSFDENKRCMTPPNQHSRTPITWRNNTPIKSSPI